MYCEGFWGEGVCTADMHFCGEPTADGDAVAEYLRVWYEANREGWWERSRYNPNGRRWTVCADNLMLGMVNEVARIEAERLRQVKALPAA